MARKSYGQNSFVLATQQVILKNCVKWQFA